MNKKAERLIQLLDKSPPGDVVEIGSIRHPKEFPTEGFSTYYLSLHCKKIGRNFISCEIDEKNVKMSTVVLGSFGLSPTIINEDGKVFLKTKGPVSMLYLDSSRFPKDTWEQYIEAEMCPNGIIAIDDAHLIDGHPYGKAQLVVDFLEKKKIKFNITDTEPTYRMIDFILPNGKKSGTEEWA